MDELAEILGQSSPSEQLVNTTLKRFNEKNSTNFDITTPSDVKLRVSQVLLESINPLSSTATEWSPATVATSLTCLRIMCRGRPTLPILCSSDTLTVIASLADINVTEEKRRYDGTLSEDQVKVIVESVKCLCNIYLMNKHLVSGSGQLGLVTGISHRLSLHHVLGLPHDLLYYDLRLLFLLTACDPVTRVTLREQHNGLLLMNSLIDTVLFNARQSPPTPIAHVVHLGEIPVRQSVIVLEQPLSDDSMNVLCEVLKIIFNQTVHLTDDVKLSEDELRCFSQLVYLLRILLLSLPSQINDTSLKTIGHVTEVLVNSPGELAASFVLPSDTLIAPNLSTLYPHVYNASTQSSDIVEGGVASGVGVVYSLCVDRVLEGHNMAAIVTLLNYLHVRLCSGSGGPSSLTPVLTALRRLAKANRIIRRFLKSQILPPLGEVTSRPDEGNTLKSKLVRLMTAAGGHGAEDVVADLLFVLCKENTARLIKYTGYGNAAGLLMSRGLMGGTPSPGAGDYSSDDESSDTEEYIKSQDKVDEMTGGVMREGPSPLDTMTEEEKEQEAIKLNELIHRLNSHGIIKMMPLTEKPPPNTDGRNSDSD